MHGSVLLVGGAKGIVGEQQSPSVQVKRAIAATPESTMVQAEIGLVTSKQVTARMNKGRATLQTR